MKKFTTLLVTGLCLFAMSASAQYYVNSYINAGTNPGGLNNDPDQPFGATGVTAADGYTSVIANGTTALTWSANQSIPFSFDFNGSSVSSYKVSTSGVLTFTTSASTVPAFNNVNIPDATIPDNSLMVWGLQPITANDGVHSKTFGTAPNRQHWVTYASYSAPGAPTGAQWTYWSIVLEETSNKIYFVDRRTYLTPLSLTVGVQIDGTTAIEVGGSPNINSTTDAPNQDDASDNTYYEFIPGTRPADDAALITISVPSTVTAGFPQTISGTISNGGSAPLTSVDVNWSDDGRNTVNTYALTGINVAPQGNTNFSHPDTWSPDPGSYDFEVWLSSPNGNADGNTTNDAISQGVLVSNGNTVSRNPLLEEFTTAPCQFCPDGTVRVEQITAANPNVIPVGVHSCFSTDAMTNTEASELCTTLGPGAAPSAMVDRYSFNGTVSSSSRPTWSTWANQRVSTSSPVGVNLNGSYDNSTRNLTVNVISNFVDFVIPGDLRVSLIITEDSVIGGTTNAYDQGYDQVNYYYGQPGHPYYQVGTFPTQNSSVYIIDDFPHRHVLRDILPSTWGDASVLPSSPTLYTDYTGTFSTTLNGSYDISKVYVIGVVSYFGDGDQEGYEVLNARQVKLTELWATGLEESGSLDNSLRVYPNPSNLPFTNMEFKMEESANVQARITDITGKVVSLENFGTMSQGNQRIQLNTQSLENGFYFVNLTVGDQEVSRKISILK